MKKIFVTLFCIGAMQSFSQSTVEIDSIHVTDMDTQYQCGVYCTATGIDTSQVLEVDIRTYSEDDLLATQNGELEVTNGHFQFIAKVPKEFSLQRKARSLTISIRRKGSESHVTKTKFF